MNAIDGEDLRDWPERRLRAVIPRSAAQTRVLYHDHIEGRGVALFEAMRGRDLEEVSGAAATGFTVTSRGLTPAA
jgi:hypothetical protein